jgi:hypothetical protein
VNSEQKCTACIFSKIFIGAYIKFHFKIFGQWFAGLLGIIYTGPALPNGQFRRPVFALQLVCLRPAYTSLVAFGQCCFRQNLQKNKY